MLHYDTYGKGRPVVLLHGWAMNRRVWDGVLPHLAELGCVIAVDLPGHGKSDLPSNGNYDLDTLADAVMEIVEPDTVLIGWSLGGLVALNLAIRHPHLLKKLVLVAGTPQFVQSTDWPNAVNKDTINGFAQDLVNDYRATILRFLAIQALGSEHAKQAIKNLRDKVFVDGEPELMALSEGLHLLINTNLRPKLHTIQTPTLVLLGEKDTLVPSPSGRDTTHLISNSQLAIIPGAGHAPFVSHRQEFLNSVDTFINESRK